MFQRIKGAIDRTIAEEQARMKGHTEQTNAGSTNTPTLNRRSTSSSTGKTSSSPNRWSTKYQSEDYLHGDSSLNLDPSVFAAAFVMDDNSDPLMGGAVGEADQATVVAPSIVANQATKGATQDDKEANVSPAVSSARSDASISAELPIEVRSKLRKLDKIEGAYTELLRSYRIAHGRAVSIEPFERVLKENTPLTSIRDPDALVEYINQLNLKSDMVMEELKRLSTEKANLEKTNSKQSEELIAAKKELEEFQKPSHGSQDDSIIEKSEKRNSNEFFSFDSKMHNQGEFSEIFEGTKHLVNEVTSCKQRIGSLEDEVLTTKSIHLTEIGKLKDEIAASQTELVSKEEQLSQLTDKLLLTETQAKSTEKEMIAAREALVKKTTEFGDQLSISQKSREELQQELKLSKTSLDSLKTSVENLESTIADLKLAKKVDEARICELSIKLEASREVTTAVSEVPEPLVSEVPVSNSTVISGGGGKKRSKKKKKGGAVNANTDLSGTSTSVNLAPGSAVTSPVVSRAISPVPPTSLLALEAEITRLEAELASKENQIKRLTKHHKDTEMLREEIETLREELLDIGQEHVVSRAKIKDLGLQKSELEDRIRKFEEQIVQSDDLKTQLKDLQNEHNSLQTSTETLKSDLAATEALAQTRFRDLTELREILQRAQPELKTLRQDSETLKITRQELTAKVNEIRDLEKHEKELRSELNRVQRISVDREVEIKTLREKLAGEEKTRLKHEDVQRVTSRDMRRVQAEKIEIAAREEKATRELQKMQVELQKLRPSLQELEDKAEKLQNEKIALQEEIDLKNQQHSNLQSLISSMRDETSELRTQLREAQSQAESVTEELAEVQRLLGERTQEAETMRRLLADVDERADTKVREIRARLEAAQEERDRIEDESSALARRKTREEMDMQESHAMKSLDEMQSVVADLRTALEASEKQLHDVETQKSELRGMLNESKQRYERTLRDLKTAQVRLSSSNARSSIDSTRPSNTVGVIGGIDPMYIKTVLLQFLEQKDARLRAQLVPVLGRLLSFNDSDTKKWTTVVQAMGNR